MRYVFKITPEGKLPIGMKETLAHVIPGYAGKTVELELKEYKKRTSRSQQEYYFAVIVPAWMKILHETQDEYYDNDETHEFLMEEVGGWFQPLKKGQKRARRRSYMDLSTEEAEKHHTLCRAKAAEEHYKIDEPNEGMYNY